MPTPTPPLLPTTPPHARSTRGRGGRRTATPSPHCLSGKNEATIIAIECLVQDEELLRDVIETICNAIEEERHPVDDPFTRTRKRIEQLRIYVEQVDMAAGLRKRLPRGPFLCSVKDIIYPTLLHEIEMSETWKQMMEHHRRGEGGKRA